MKLKKTYIPIIAVSAFTAAGLASVIFDNEQEKETPKISASQQEENSASTQVPIEFTRDSSHRVTISKNGVVTDDPAAKKIVTNIIVPLTTKELIKSSFSRMGPTHHYSYQLIETTTNSSSNERNFDVILNKTKSGLFVVPKESELVSQEDLSILKPAKPEQSHFLDLKFLEDENQLLVKLKSQWVSVDQHPITKGLGPRSRTSFEDPPADNIFNIDLYRSAKP